MSVVICDVDRIHDITVIEFVMATIELLK